MSSDVKAFGEASRKSLGPRLPVGTWAVYPEYRIWVHGAPSTAASADQSFYISAVPPGPELDSPVPKLEGVHYYSPLRVPGLFLEFANLFEGGRSLEEAHEIILQWIHVYGVLGVNATYPIQHETDGMEVGRFDDRESVMNFARLSVEAGRCLNLFNAARHPGKPDDVALEALGVRGDSPEELADGALSWMWDVTNSHLQNETSTRLYRDRDAGQLFRGPAFHSLLGAMFLQFSDLLTAPEEDIRRCRWCADVIDFEIGKPPPSDAPRGTRGTHKTHRNRKYCKRKHGVESYCKNQYHRSLRR